MSAPLPALPRSRSSRPRRLLLRGLALLLAALLADLILTAPQVKGGLEQTRAALEDARDALEIPDTKAAGMAFENASDRSRRALDALRRPALAVAAHLPLLGREIAVIRALGEVGSALARAGIIATDLVEVEGSDPGALLSTIFRKGRVRFGPLQQAAEGLAGARRIIQSASDELAELPSSRVGSLGDAVSSARGIVRRALEELDRFATATDLVRGFAAPDSRARYLIVFQSPSEARGGGGIAGVTAILQFSDGRLRVQDALPYLAFGPTSRVSAPSWFVDTYGPFLADRQWPQANMALHFPTTAEVMLKMYEEARGTQLDGLLVIDPIGMRSILPAIDGGIEAPGFDRPLDASNIVPVLLEKSYRSFEDPRDQERALLALVNGFFRSIRTTPLDGQVFVEGVSEALATQHLKIYLRDSELEVALGSLGIDADYTSFGPSLQAHFTNNISANKVDYFLRQSLEIEAYVDGDVASVRSSITYVNEAPQGPPSVQLGPAPGFGDPPGTLRMYAAAMLPEGAVLQGYEVDGRPIDPFEGRELAHPLIWTTLRLLPGRTTTIDVRYEMELLGDEFTLTLFPQAVVDPATYSVQVTGTGEGTSSSEGVLDRPTPIQV